MYEEPLCSLQEQRFCTLDVFAAISRPSKMSKGVKWQPQEFCRKLSSYPLAMGSHDMFNILIFHKRYGVNEKVNLTKWNEESNDWKIFTSTLEYNGLSFHFQVFKLIPSISGVGEMVVGIHSRILSMFIKHTTAELRPILKLPIFERSFTHKGQSSIKHNLTWSCWRISGLVWSFSTNWHIVWLWEDCFNMKDEDIIHQVAITSIRNNKFNKGFSKCEPLDLSSLKHVLNIH